MPNEKYFPIEGIDFDFVETNDEIVSKRSRNPVVKLHGTYEGVLAQYGKIQVHVEETPPRIEFDFTVLNSGKYPPGNLETDTGFRNTLGDIIVTTINSVAERAKAQNENRNDNP